MIIITLDGQVMQALTVPDEDSFKTRFDDLCGQAAFFCEVVPAPVPLSEADVDEFFDDTFGGPQ